MQDKKDPNLKSKDGKITANVIHYKDIDIG